MKKVKLVESTDPVLRQEAVAVECIEKQVKPVAKALAQKKLNLEKQYRKVSEKKCTSLENRISSLEAEVSRLKSIIVLQESIIEDLEQ